MAEGNDELHLSYALIELRRSAFRYVDQKGKLAADLAKSYENISFGAESGGVLLSYFELLAVELEGKTRRGSVNGQHAVVEDLNPTEMDRFAKESMAFLRRVERQLEVERYDRVGIRFTFELPTPKVGAAADQYFGFRDPKDWTLSGFDTRFERVIDDWNVGLRMFAGLTAIENGATYDGKAKFDVDQYRMSVSPTEAFHLPVLDCYSRARSIVEQFGRQRLEQ